VNEWDLGNLGIVIIIMQHDRSEAETNHNTNNANTTTNNLPLLSLHAEQYNEWGLSCWKKFRNPFP
jgi:hypothetical protein